MKEENPDYIKGIRLTVIGGILVAIITGLFSLIKNCGDKPQEKTPQTQVGVVYGDYVAGNKNTYNNVPESKLTKPSQKDNNPLTTIKEEIKIMGTVKELDGSSIPLAKVKLSINGKIYTTYANGEGDFEFEIGKGELYARFTVSKEGYETGVQDKQINNNNINLYLKHL